MAKRRAKLAGVASVALLEVKLPSRRRSIQPTRPTTGGVTPPTGPGSYKGGTLSKNAPQEGPITEFEKTVKVPGTKRWSPIQPQSDGSTIVSLPSGKVLRLREGVDPSSLETISTEYFGLELYECQRSVLRDLGVENARVAVKAANGSGKTTRICAPAVLAFMLKYSDAKVVTTSGVFRQVKEQMWPEIRRLADGLNLGFEVNQVEMDLFNGSRAVGFSTDQPGKFEGWHAGHLLIILDESKTIGDGIFEAVDRCVQGSTDARVLVLSSPGGSSGEFYRIFQEQGEFWDLHTISAFDCGHIDKREVEKLIAKRGEGHPLVRSMVFGEFMDDSGDRFCLTDGQLRMALTTAPIFRGGGKVGFCDFAAGGDENVFCWRDGNRIGGMVAWTDRNTMSAVGRFIVEIRKAGMDPTQVWGDDGGIGHSMIDAMWEAGCEINRENNAFKARDSREYANRGAEIWMEGCEQIWKGEVDLGVLKYDEQLHRQLTARKWDAKGSKGTIRVESKDEMKKRGVSSPDRADALLGCLECGVTLQMQCKGVAKWGDGGVLGAMGEQMQEHDMAGFFAG